MIQFNKNKTQVVITKEKKSNDKACFTIMIALTYTTPGDKHVTLKAEVSVAGMKELLTTSKSNPPKVSLTAVKLNILPVTTRTPIAFDSPINIIHNPSGVLVLDLNAKEGDLALTDENVAILQINSILPDSFKLEDDDDRVVWSIESVDRNGKLEQKAPQRADFFTPPGGKKDNTGKKARIYGIAEGRIRVNATLKGNKEPCEFYEALVVKQKDLFFRVQLLQGKKFATIVTPEQAVQQIAIANRYLRQVGVRLIADEDTTTTDKAVLVKDTPGFFTAKVDDTALFQIDHDAGLKTIGINHRSNVVNICYVFSNNPSTLATTYSNPGNENGREITLIYRIVAAASPTKHTMFLLEERLQQDKTIWGCAITNKLGNPLDKKTKLVDPAIQKLYGIAIAHEMGHVMNLKHRASDFGVGGFFDNLKLPGGQNLMFATANAVLQRSAEDLDLIQCYAVRGSKALKP